MPTVCETNYVVPGSGKQLSVVVKRHLLTLVRWEPIVTVPTPGVHGQSPETFFTKNALRKKKQIYVKIIKSVEL